MPTISLRTPLAQVKRLWGNGGPKELFSLFLFLFLFLFPFSFLNSFSSSLLFFLRFLSLLSLFSFIFCLDTLPFTKANSGRPISFTMLHETF